MIILFLMFTTWFLVAETEGWECIILVCIVMLGKMFLVAWVYENNDIKNDKSLKKHNQSLNVH